VLNEKVQQMNVANIKQTLDQQIESFFSANERQPEALAGFLTTIQKEIDLFSRQNPGKPMRQELQSITEKIQPDAIRAITKRIQFPDKGLSKKIATLFNDIRKKVGLDEADLIIEMNVEHDEALAQKLQAQENGQQPPHDGPVNEFKEAEPLGLTQAEIEAQQRALNRIKREENQEKQKRAAAIEQNWWVSTIFPAKGPEVILTEDLKEPEVCVICQETMKINEKACKLAGCNHHLHQDCFVDYHKEQRKNFNADKSSSANEILSAKEGSNNGCKIHNDYTCPACKESYQPTEEALARYEWQKSHKK
jgi:hypothetical protein